jgi:hypothetical protein
MEHLVHWLAAGVEQQIPQQKKVKSSVDSEQKVHEP